MVLADVCSFLCHYLLLFNLLCNNLGCWDPRYLFQLHWLKPALQLDHFFLDLGDTESIVVQGEVEAGTHLLVTLLREDAGLRAMIIAIERIFESKRVHNLELFPDNDPGSAQLASFDPKPARR